MTATTHVPTPSITSKAAQTASIRWTAMNKAAAPISTLRQAPTNLSSQFPRSEPPISDGYAG